MLTLVGDRLNRTCEGYCRRDFLRIGSLLPGGLSLASILSSRSDAATASAVRGRSVVLLFLQGGPSHIEFFDPKMTAPAEIRSITGQVWSKIPGVGFGGTFPKLAAIADRINIVRSYASGNAGHSYLGVVSGGNPLGASISSIYSRVAGTVHPATGIPTNTLILPEAVKSGLTLKRNFETNALPTLTAAGELGSTYEAFNPSGGGPLMEDMTLRIAKDRILDRKSLLRKLDQLRRAADSDGSLERMDKYKLQAFEIIVKGIGRAFDLSTEDPKVIQKYDTTGQFRLDDVHRYGDMRRASNLLGHQMLLARRLCEAGCGFVTVSDCGWDMHANGNSPKNMQGIWPLGYQVDHAVSAFLDDVRQRGLSDRILLAVTGEMGRTPRINRNGGRDHYGSLTSLLLAGGGTTEGQVVGRSDRSASEPATRRYSPKHFLGTLIHTLFDVAELRVQRDLPSALIRLAEQSEPIAELVG